MDVKTLGLKTAQGLQLADSVCWDMDDESRTFAERFVASVWRPPASGHAAVYSAVLHYLKAVKAAGSRDADGVMAKMRELPVSDFLTHYGKLRADGRPLREMYLFDVKKPQESKGDWDLYKLVKRVPGVGAFRSADKCNCSLVTAPNRPK